MSGSGSASSTIESQSHSDSCETLDFFTQLASPKEEVIDLFKEDDFLDITLNQEGGQAVVHALWNGEIAGGIASQQISSLRKCLVGGYMFRAKVLSKQNGQVRVRVSPVKSA